MKLVQAKHAAGEIKLPIEVGDIPGQAKMPETELYGRMLERAVSRSLPDNGFRRRSTAGIEERRRARAASGRNVGTFLDRHENFELLNTSVDDFLKSGIHPDFQAVAEDQSFRLELKAVQRVFKLAPTFEATDALLADDLHSAQKIYRMGESEFVRRYSGHGGFTAESARLTWNRAADTHAAVVDDRR